MKVAFSSFYFVFRVFLLTFDLFKSVAFKWCVEWVIAVQTILWWFSFSENIPKFEFYKIPYKSYIL